MKTFAYIFMSILTLSFSEKPLTFEDLNENIRCEARKCFNPEENSFEKQYGKPPLPEFIGYDVGCISGKTERMESFTQSRSYTANMLWKYNSQGRLIFLQSGQYITTFKYDKAGNLIEINEPESLQKIEYNGSNYTKYAGNGFIFYSNRSGLTIKDKRYSKAGKLELTIIKQFDDKKRLVVEETICMDGDDDNSKFIYSYNDKGQVIKKISVFSNFRDTVFMFYNAYGFIERDSSINGKGHISKAFYTYDINNEDNGITIKKNRLYADSSGGPLIYTFDQKGNWTHCKNYTGKVLQTEEVRKIYYRQGETKPAKK